MSSRRPRGSVFAYLVELTCYWPEIVLFVVMATLGMNVTDYFDDGKNWSIKLHEKNGKSINMPVQHRLEEYLDAYIEAAAGMEEFPFELGKNGRPTNSLMSGLLLSGSELVGFIQSPSRASPPVPASVMVSFTRIK